MNFHEFFFIVQFIAFIAVFLAMFYNVLMNGKVFDIRKAIILFVLQWILFFIGLALTLTDISMNVDDLNVAYSTFFGIQATIITLHTILFFIHWFFHWRDTVQQALEPRNSLRERR